MSIGQESLAEREHLRPGVIAEEQRKRFETSVEKFSKSIGVGRNQRIETKSLPVLPFPKGTEGWTGRKPNKPQSSIPLNGHLPHKDPQSDDWRDFNERLRTRRPTRIGVPPSEK